MKHQFVITVESDNYEEAKKVGFKIDTLKKQIEAGIESQNDLILTEIIHLHEFKIIKEDESTTTNNT